VLWALLWIVLGLGAVLVLFLVGRRLWRKAQALISEMGTASERLGAVAAALEELADPTHPPEPPPPPVRQARGASRRQR
jgi:hypothetical protein